MKVTNARVAAYFLIHPSSKHLRLHTCILRCSTVTAPDGNLSMSLKALRSTSVRLLNCPSRITTASFSYRFMKSATYSMLSVCSSFCLRQKAAFICERERERERERAILVCISTCKCHTCMHYSSSSIFSVHTPPLTPCLPLPLSIFP